MPPLDAPIELRHALQHLTPEETEGLSGAALFCWDLEHDRLCFSEAAEGLGLTEISPTGWSLDQALTVVAADAMVDAERIVAAMRALRPIGPVELAVDSPIGRRIVEVSTLVVPRGGREFVIGAIRDRTEAHSLFERLAVTARVMSNLARVAKIGAWELDVLRRRVEVSEQAATIVGVQGPLRFDEIATLVPPELKSDPDALRFVAAVRQCRKAEFVGRAAFGGRQQHYLRFTADPIRESDGAVLRIDGTVSDVTSHVEAGRRGGWLEAAFAATAQGVCITDAEQRIVMVNPAFTELTGYRASEVIGQRPSILASGRQERAFYDAMWRSIRYDGRWTGELWNRRRDGTEYLESLTIVALRDIDRVVGYVGLFSDLTAREAARERRLWLQEHDPTTRLLNRAGLERALRQRPRVADERLALITFDLDGFSAINHRFGAKDADQVLYTVARRVAECAGVQAYCARLGSDDFAVVLTKADEAEDVVSHLRRRVRDVIEVHSERLHLDAAFGLAIGPPAADGGLGDLARQATISLTEARATGRGAVVRFDPSLGERSRTAFELAHALPDAVQAGQLHVVFQPQRSLTTGRIVGAEALMRWTHPSRGAIRPDHFIAAAETTGDIIAIGSLALREALNLIRQADAAGLHLPRVAVNVSPSELRAGGLVNNVRVALASHGVDPHRLELEVTEGVLASQQEAIGQLTTLRRIGVQVAIDDFGVGFSSLGRLKHLPLDRLKIDRGFVIGLPGDSADASVCRSIIDLAHHMGLDVIAEGVETAEQTSWLATAGCDETQGYWGGRPMDMEALLRCLADEHVAEAPT
ncbi:MAG: EAL domain-containing protein [Deltaproteobacteria bacterium]|nr:EAL domain-containing protein [Deltaproteobacteria bacterium]